MHWIGEEVHGLDLDNFTKDRINLRVNEERTILKQMQDRDQTVRSYANRMKQSSVWFTSNNADHEAMLLPNGGGLVPPFDTENLG